MPGRDCLYDSLFFTLCEICMLTFDRRLGNLNKGILLDTENVLKLRAQLCC